MQMGQIEDNSRTVYIGYVNVWSIYDNATELISNVVSSNVICISNK